MVTIDLNGRWISYLLEEGIYEHRIDIKSLPKLIHVWRNNYKEIKWCVANNVNENIKFIKQYAKFSDTLIISMYNSDLTPIYDLINSCVYFKTIVIYLELGSNIKNIIEIVENLNEACKSTFIIIKHEGEQINFY